MKLKKLILLTLLAPFSGIAQDVTINNGPQFNMTKGKEEVVNILNMDRSNFSFLTRINKKYRVINLDESLSLTKSTQLEIPKVKKKEVKFLSASQIGLKTYFFSQYFDKKGDVMTMFASELDVFKGVFGTHYEPMAVQDNKFNIFSRPFIVSRSRDSSKILMACVYPTKNKEKARVAIMVTDNELNEIWKNDIIFDELDKNFSIDQYLLDKDGNLHISATVRMTNEEKREKDAKGRYKIAIYSYFHENQELKQYEIGFQNEIILTANLELNNKNELIGTGFYGEKKLFDAGMKGFFFLRIDPGTKEVVATNLSPFDKEFLGQLMNKRKAEKGKGLFNYVIRDTYVNDAGEMTVVAEYYFYDITYDQNGNIQMQTWVFGNVLVFRIDQNGKMTAASILKKNQMAVAKNSVTNLALGAAGLSLYPGGIEVAYYGIGSMYKNDKLYLIYNENPKNEERLKSDKKPRSVRMKSSVTMLVTFEKDGEVSSNVLFKSKDKKAGYNMPLMPRYNFNYSDNAMIVIGRKGKKARVTELIVN